MTSMAESAIMVGMSTKGLEPAASIVALFQGAPAVARITGRDPSRVYRWMLPAHKGGTDGEIPAKARRRLLEYAREHNIPLKPEAFIASESVSA